MLRRKRLFVATLMVVLIGLVVGIMVLLPYYLSLPLLSTIFLYYFIFVFSKGQFHCITSITSGVLLLGTIVILNMPEETKHMKMIVVFLLYAILLFVVWILFYLYDVAEKAKDKLNRELAALNKYDDQQYKIFTYQEWLERSAYITESCKRNNKRFCCVTIDAKNKAAPTYKAIRHHIKVSLIETFVIPNFDLIGHNEAGNYIVLLQNCTKEAADTRIREYIVMLNEKVELKETDLLIEVKEGNV